MKARLTRIEAKRRGKTIALGSGELRIGRDPDCDIVIEGVRVSRLHAMIRTLGERHTLIDTNSTNGTTVNGVALKRAPALLESGDLIELSGEFAYLYETGPTVSARRWMMAAGAMLSLALMASGIAVWLRVFNDPVLEAATELAREGQIAAERDDLSITYTRLSEATRLLVRHGYLDHVERAELAREAMNTLAERMEEHTDLWALLQRAQRAERERAAAAIGSSRGTASSEAAHPEGLGGEMAPPGETDVTDWATPDTSPEALLEPGSPDPAAP